jgi:hypothetical protein
MPVAEVPDWISGEGLTERPDGYPTWWHDMQEWLSKRGLAFVEIQLERKTWMPLPFECWAIFIGPNADGERHAIVGKVIHDKFCPIHDPAGGEAAVAFQNGRVEAVCFLVPIDPSAVKFRTADVRQAMRTAKASSNISSNGG